MSRLLEATDLAWAAGFFEGEGCTTVQRRVGGVSKTNPAMRRGYLRLSATQTNYEQLERLQRVLGGRINGPYNRHLRKDGTPTKTQWVWNLSKRDECLLALNRMWDWLSEIRRDQARAAILRTA